MENELKEKLAEIRELTTSKISEIEIKQKELGDKIDKKLEEMGPVEMGEEFKKEFKGMINQEMKTYLESSEQMQKQLDSLNDEFKKGTFKNESETFRSELHKNLENSNEFKTFMSGNSNKAKFDIKAHLVTDSNASGDVVAAQRIAGVKYDPSRLVRMRDIVARGGNTSSNHTRHIQETSYTNNAAMKEEASGSGESEFKLDAIDTNAETLMTHITMSKEMFDDLNIATSYIAMRVPQKVLDVEDTQILTGNGSAPNIQGLAVSGGVAAYAADADASASNGFRNFFLPTNYGFDASGSVNEYDVLVTSCYQLAKNNYNATAILVHPFQWYALALRKGTDLTYVREGIMTIMGVPVIKNTAVTIGAFLTADFNQAAQLFFRQGVGIEMSDSNNDDFEKHMVTVRAVERILMPIYLTNAGNFGTFAAAKTALQ